MSSSNVMRENGGGDEVETCSEVNFVPLENDFGVFSGEESYYSDVEPVPVVLKEKVEVEDEGDVKEVIEINDDDEDDEGDDNDDEDAVDVELENKMADKRKMQRVYQSVGDEDEEDGLENFMRSTRTKSAKFWVGQTKSYESKIDELRKELALVKDGFRAAKRMADRYKEDLDILVVVNTQLQDENWELHERNQKLQDENARLEMTALARQRNKRQRIEELRREVEDEKRRRRNVEEELEATRKRLWTFTRRSLPRKSNRLVFKKHAADTWDAIVKFFKDTQTLSKRYSKNLSYMLQKQRQCANSYSTVILLVIAYPRHRQKHKEISEQFIIDSGLKSHFPTWGISACKSYAYLSPEEYIKLLNTHAEGCFVSHIYPRFRASTDEWDSRMIRQRQEEDDAFRAFTKDWRPDSNDRRKMMETTTMVAVVPSPAMTTIAAMGETTETSHPQQPPPPMTRRRHPILMMMILLHLLRRLLSPRATRRMDRTLVW